MNTNEVSVDSRKTISMRSAIVVLAGLAVLAVLFVLVAAIGLVRRTPSPRTVTVLVFLWVLWWLRSSWHRVPPISCGCNVKNAHR